MSTLSQTFEVLGEPTRLRIVEELRGGERTVGSLVAALGVCQPGVSRHLRILHEAGIVQFRPVGQRRLYALRRQPFRDLDSWMHHYRDLVEARFDHLDQLVKETRPSSHPATSYSRGG